MGPGGAWVRSSSICQVEIAVFGGRRGILDYTGPTCWLLKLWSRDSSTGITWEHVRNAEPQAPPQTYYLRIAF